jgi:hypothetical protein
MATYSFLNVAATYVGVTGNFNIGAGAALAEEGISITMTDDKDTLVIGADGTPMHSLNAGKAGQITVRLQKTSPTNRLLSVAYDTSTASSALFGNDTIIVQDTARGDIITCTGVAFRKLPDINYGSG